MRLVFDHIEGIGKITEGDFIHAPALMCEVNDDEIYNLMEQGWAVDEWYLPRRMYQARQVRLRVPANMRAPKLPAGLQFTHEYEPDIDELVRVYNAYKAHKGFSDHLPIRTTLEMVDRDRKSAIMFYKDGKLVGFTLLRIHQPALESMQFCWDYAEPKLRLGYLSQDIEFLIAEHFGCSHVYIGPGYEDACYYKSRLPGFEWWTGEEWSTDKALYRKLIARDSQIKTIEEAMTRHDAAAT
jgi:hypothetical protein